MAKKPSRRGRSQLPDLAIRFVGHLDRPPMLPSTTYKIQPTDGATKPIYITVSDHMVEGELRPFEVFINGADAGGFQFVQITARLLSSRLQEPGPLPSFLIDELKEAFDASGGYLVKEAWLRPGGRQRRVPSVIAHIGLVLEYHIEGLKKANEKRG